MLRIGYRRRRGEELEQLVEAAEVKVSADYRTRSRSRYSTAARIWRASHAVQSSHCGNPGTPVLRPTATSLTARCWEPWCSHKARNRCVRATDGSSSTHE